MVEGEIADDPRERDGTSAPSRVMSSCQGFVMNKRDRWSSVFCLGVGIFFIIASFGFSIWDRYGPGPGFFPLCLGFLFSILSVLLFVMKVLSQQEGERLGAQDSLRFSTIQPTVLYLGLLVLFFLFFERLGSLLTILFFMVGVLIGLAKRPVRQSLTISIVTSALTYVIFVRLLGVPLPGGILQKLIRFY
jgi:putative tricarboxylic transport membrane protein